jgi:site-specific DNA-adenine methylase
VEPFCGAAALYFMKKPAKVEVLNDISGELVNLTGWCNTTWRSLYASSSGR